MSRLSMRPNLRNQKAWYITAIDGLNISPFATLNVPQAGIESSVAVRGQCSYDNALTESIKTVCTRLN